jgi:AraC-like DNA-binding protein
MMEGSTGGSQDGRHSAGGARPRDEVSGSCDDTPNLPVLWLNFLCENLFPYRLVGEVPRERFRVRARSRNAAGFTVARIQTSGGASFLDRSGSDIDRDLRDRISLYIPLAGRLHTSQLGRELDYGLGGLALVSAREPTSQIKRGDNDTLCFLMPREFVDQRAVHPEEICLRPSSRDDPMARLLRDTLVAFQETAHQLDDDKFSHAACLIGELVLMAMGGAADVTSGAPSVRGANLARAKRIIRSRLGDFDLSIASIARECGFSVSYLHNLFRDDGRTAWEYLKGERLRHAREMLRLGADASMNITDIALASGFSNMSQFSTAFREAFGIAPRGFRASIGKHPGAALKGLPPSKSPV